MKFNFTYEVLFVGYFNAATFYNTQLEVLLYHLHLHLRHLADALI